MSAVQVVVADDDILLREGSGQSCLGPVGLFEVVGPGQRCDRGCSLWWRERRPQPGCGRHSHAADAHHRGASTQHAVDPCGTARYRHPWCCLRMSKFEHATELLASGHAIGLPAQDPGHRRGPTSSTRSNGISPRARRVVDPRRSFRELVSARRRRRTPWPCSVARRTRGVDADGGGPLQRRYRPGAALGHPRVPSEKHVRSILTKLKPARKPATTIVVSKAVITYLEAR